MKILAEISEASLGKGEPEILGSDYELRKSARAILRDKNGNINLQHIKRDSFHKLPGGGLETGESIEEALRREIVEEAGCDCIVGDLIGVVIEYRNKYNLIQISYAYVADMVGEIGEPQFEQAEIDEQLTNYWMSPKEALEKMKSDKPEKYEGDFILKREISFLEEYLKTVN
ncbi:MAG: NUDIX domain-containing protein [Candidatus Pacebacteria bacterium]|nr:NUDIX domain-containing protein [Candidatus Paceibacterota bacterium]